MSRRKKQTRLGRWLKKKDRQAAKLLKRRDTLYNCLHFPLVFMSKTGITNKMPRRMKEINDSVPGFLIPIPFCCLRLRNARKHEKRIHNVCRWFRLTFVGSGKTEYFFALALFFAIPYTWFIYDLQQHLGAGFILLLTWLYFGHPLPTI